MQARTATPAPPATQTAASGAGSPATAGAERMSLRQLRALRDEISSQLSNVNDRRAEIASELRTAAPGADKIGIEQRLGVLDARIAQMETDLAYTGKLVQTARGNDATTSAPPPPPPGEFSRGQLTAISMVFTLAVLMPLAMAWGRAITRRASRQSEQPSQEIVSRLDRMEEGIEAIALEVERISEGQRFVTKVIGGGTAEPVAIPNREKIELQR